MALALEKFLFNVIIQTMMLTISWSLLSSLLPSSNFLLTVSASYCLCFHNKSGRLMFLKCTVQHLWKNPPKSTGTRRDGLLLAWNAEHCQGEFQLCPAVFSQFSPRWQTPGWMGRIDEALPTNSDRFKWPQDLYFFSPLFCAQVSTCQAGSLTLGISHY